MADTAKRLVGPLMLPVTNAVLYTAPASTTTIIRNIHVTNVTTGASTFTLAVNGNSTNTAFQIYNGFNVGPGTSFDWSGMLVLAAGETLQGISASSALNIVVCGVEVS